MDPIDTTPPFGVNIKPRFLSRTAAVAYLGIDESKIRRFPDALLPKKRVGRNVVYRYADVERVADMIERGELTTDLYLPAPNSTDAV